MPFDIREHGHQARKVLWRKVSKDSTKKNIFAEQFVPNVPWAQGKWFVKLNAGVILEQHPELFVDTPKSLTMSYEDYIQYLKDHFETF